MESNEKRAKRPRIQTQASQMAESIRETPVNRQPRPYQPRYNGNTMSDSGYQPRANNREDYSPRNDRSYSSRESQNRQRFNYDGGGFQRESRSSQGYSSGFRNQGQHRVSTDYNREGYRQNNYEERSNFDNRGGYSPRGNSFGNRGRSFGNNRNNGFQRPSAPVMGGKKFVPRPTPVQYEVQAPDPNEQIRLNKFMANSGICSRREADEYIKEGLVKVNGRVVTELGTKISHSDNVEFDEKIVALENKTYILLNKPKDCVTTSDDPQGRLTVMDLVKGACNERIYPVGRLDRNTTGVLLLTNDGDLASKLTHPKFVKKKIYHVWCDRNIAQEDMQRIADGIELEDGPIHADAISYATPTDFNQAGIEIHSGQNRIVRRIFEKLGYHVTKLDRVYFAGLTKKNLPRGRWRYLTQQEVNQLKRGAFE